MVAYFRTGYVHLLASRGNSCKAFACETLAVRQKLKIWSAISAECAYDVLKNAQDLRMILLI